MKEEKLKQIISDLINWAYEVNGTQGVRDAMYAANLSEKDMEELNLDTYLEEEEYDEEEEDE